MLHPIDNFTVETLLDSDVGHGRRRSRAMPMLFAGSKPDDITRMDVQYGSTLQLRPPRACCHDQSLTKGMSVPGCARARLERDACASDASRRRRLK